MERLKKFIHKDIDPSQKYVNPTEFHNISFFFLRVFCVADDPALIPKWAAPVHYFIIVNTFVILAICINVSYNAIAIMDIVLLSEAGTYFIIFIYLLLILSCTKNKENIRNYYNLQQILKEDFSLASTLAQDHRKKFYKNQVETRKMCLMSVFFISGGCTSLYIITWLLLAYYYITHEKGDGTDRPLLFSIRIPDLDIFKSPAYEITFIFSNQSIMTVAYVYSFMLQTQILWVKEIATKADLMIYLIEDLMDGIEHTDNPIDKAKNNALLKTRFRLIIKQHHSMYSLLQNFAGVYKKCLMYEQKCGSPLICLTAFGVYKKLLTDGLFHPVLFVLCITTILVVFIPSYFCTYLGIKIRSICDACWNTPFWNSSGFVRPYFVLIMQRCQRPLPLQAPGFEEVSLLTFSSKMAGAYSMFNMLRQMDFGP